LKRKKNILIIILLILFWKCSDNVLGPNMNNNYLSSLGSDQTIDIMTWNIEHFPKNQLTVNYLANIITTLNVDILALQEIESLDSLNSLKERLGDYWLAYRSLGSSNYGQLAYLIDTTFVKPLVSNPHIILNSSDEYNFAYRLPFVLQFSFNEIPFTTINVHYKCCDGSEDRRLAASQALNEYIQTNLNNENLIILGDFNDIIENQFIDVLEVFNNTNEYIFADYGISAGSTNNWSYPNYPSHIDHIIISNELFEYEYTTTTVLVDNLFLKFQDYDNFISDHRPILISINMGAMY